MSVAVYPGFAERFEGGSEVWTALGFRMARGAPIRAAAAFAGVAMQPRTQRKDAQAMMDRQTRS